ncbi:MAG: 2-oxoacid ferredoxin oxidoreductase [Elusimicrobia bacterium]|nr:2-oxoacid ferredoxin oxidoreductase [Elusimicrobiota bacterium]
MPIEEMIKDIHFKSETRPDWCPSCGDFGVLSALIKALVQLQIPPHEAVTVSGIGCSSNLPGFIHTYGFHSLHGRSLPVATGIKLANPKLTVVATGGDGDGYGIGIGHLIHALRRGVKLTYIVMNNQIYGLTTGQVSPTSDLGHVTKTTPEGSDVFPVNPIRLAIAGGASFVARGFSGDPKGLVDLIAQAIKHPGFALVDVFSPCVTFNKVNTFDFFRSRVYRLEETGHLTGDFAQAMARAGEWGDKIPVGLFWKTDVIAPRRPLAPAQDPAQGLDASLWQNLIKEFQ